MNSRLNLALREKHGFVYAIDAHFMPFIDTGLFGIYFGTEPNQLERSIRLVHKELRKLMNTPLGTLQLHHAKEQLLGQLAMAEENNAGLMLGMGRSLLDLERIDNLEQIAQQIKRITSGELKQVANEMFDPDGLSRLTFIPN